MTSGITVEPSRRPPLDPEFVPAVLWNREFRRLSRATGERKLAVAVERTNGSVSTFHTGVFHDEEHFGALNERYVERLVKTMLWVHGGWRVTIAGHDRLARHIATMYALGGARAFDAEFMGDRVYGRAMSVESAPYERAPLRSESGSAMGGHLDGCRIGFDLGGSQRKCAALVDGEVVYSEQLPWDPYFQSDPQYHHSRIDESLKRAAARLPRVDAIGGSAAGVYVNSEVRVASLFRGVARDVFDGRVRGLFRQLQREWGGIPFVVANDGEVTALAGSMALRDCAVLGLSMGTSQAGGYVTPRGQITDWLNELAFVPVDFREGAPVDEWSGDRGTGVQYFSQQAVSRLLPGAGIDMAGDASAAEKMARLQEMMAAGDARAARVYESIGVYLGYAIAQYAEYYELRHVLVLGGVMAGEGGIILLRAAREALDADFPEIGERISIHTPREEDVRHGQAVAAASLPEVLNYQGVT